MIVVRAIKPGRPFQSSIFRDEVTRAIQVIEKDALADFHKTTATWNHKPEFESKIQIGQGAVKMTIGTDDEVYGYVDAGTKPHIIRAKTKRGLRFLGRTRRSKPKTTPNVVSSVPGQRGEGWTRKDAVKHPGTKARKFSKWIAKTTQKELNREIKNALARFTRRSGYSINK